MININECNGLFFNLKNRWEPVGHEYYGDYLMCSKTDSPLVTFASIHHQENFVPWEFQAVPGKANQYYLINRKDGDSLNGYCLSFNDVHLTVVGPDDKANWVPWEFKSASNGKLDQYYLINRWGGPDERRYGNYLSFNNNIFTIIDVDDQENIVPLELMATNIKEEPMPSPSEIQVEELLLPTLNDHHAVTPGNFSFVQHVRTAHIPASEMKDLYMQRKCPYYILETYIGWYAGPAKGNRENPNDSELHLSISQNNSSTDVESNTNTFTEKIEVTGSAGIEVEGFKSGVKVKSSKEWSDTYVTSNSSTFEVTATGKTDSVISAYSTAQIFLFGTKEKLLQPDRTIIWDMLVLSSSDQVAVYSTPPEDQ